MEKRIKRSEGKPKGNRKGTASIVPFFSRLISRNHDKIYTYTVIVHNAIIIRSKSSMKNTCG